MPFFESYCIWKSFFSGPNPPSPRGSAACPWVSSLASGGAVADRLLLAVLITSDVVLTGRFLGHRDRAQAARKAWAPAFFLAHCVYSTFHAFPFFTHALVVLLIETRIITVDGGSVVVVGVV